jgi:hypothetical protein
VLFPPLAPFSPNRPFCFFLSFADPYTSFADPYTSFADPVFRHSPTPIGESPFIVIPGRDPESPFPL